MSEIKICKKYIAKISGAKNKKSEKNDFFEMLIRVAFESFFEYLF